MSDVQQPHGEQADDPCTNGGKSPGTGYPRSVIDFHDSAMNIPDPAHPSQTNMASLVIGGLVCIALLIGVSVGHSFSGGGLHESHLA